MCEYVCVSVYVKCLGMCACVRVCVFALCLAEDRKLGGRFLRMPPSAISGVGEASKLSKVLTSICKQMATLDKLLHKWSVTLPPI